MQNVYNSIFRGDVEITRELVEHLDVNLPIQVIPYIYKYGEGPVYITMLTIPMLEIQNIINSPLIIHSSIPKVTKLIDMMEYLFNQGCRLNINNEEEITTFMKIAAHTTRYYSERMDIIKRIHTSMLMNRECGMYIVQCLLYGFNKDMLDIIVKYRQNIQEQIRNHEGSYILIRSAAINGHYDVMKFLLECGIYPD